MSSVKLPNTPHGMTKHSIFSFWGNHNFSLQAILAFLGKDLKPHRKMFLLVARPAGELAVEHAARVASAAQWWWWCGGGPLGALAST